MKSRDEFFRPNQEKKKKIFLVENEIVRIIEVIECCSLTIKQQKPISEFHTIVCGDSLNFRENMDQLRKFIIIEKEKKEEKVECLKF